MLMGKCDKVLKAAQHLAMLDGNNNQLQSQAQSTNLDEYNDEKEAVAKEGENEKESFLQEDSETPVITIDGVEKPLTELFDAPKIHK